MSITLLYASLLAIFALFLSFRAGTYRGKAGASILYGDPMNMELAQRVRAHQNFLEYVPMILILMGAIELNGGSTGFLHGIGVALIIARIAHGVGAALLALGSSIFESFREKSALASFERP